MIQQIGRCPNCGGNVSKIYDYSIVTIDKAKASCETCMTSYDDESKIIKHKQLKKINIDIVGSGIPLEYFGNFPCSG